MVIERLVGSDFVPHNIPKPSIFDFEILSFENGYHAPKLGDIWIPFLDIIRQHYVRFYMPSMENLFKLGNRIVIIEHYGDVSRMSNWKLDFRSKWIIETLETIKFCYGSKSRGNFF
jgi:hypothetical protein